MNTIKNRGARFYINRTVGTIASVMLALFFLLPTLTVLLYMLPFLFEILRPGSSTLVVLENIFSPHFFVSGIATSIVIYFLTALHLVTNIFNIKNKFFVSADKLYEKYKPLITISNTLSLTIYLQWIIFLFPSPLNSVMASDNNVLLFQAFFITVITLTHYVKPTRILNSLSVLFFMAGVLFAGFILFSFYQEFQPNYYGTFPLDDTKGVYKLNYDGDYWLTYYDVKQQCTTIQNEKQCETILEKKGNTSIIEAPEELDKYLDKSIIVTGEFVKIQGPQDSKTPKLFCVNARFGSTCRPSTGPGIWYFSPLKIETIRLR